MAATILSTTKKMNFSLTVEGKNVTQTVAPILPSAEADKLTALRDAVSSILLDEPTTVTVTTTDVIGE